jgi:hypothetical protein
MFRDSRGSIGTKRGLSQIVKRRILLAISLVLKSRNPCVTTRSALLSSQLKKKVYGMFKSGVKRKYVFFLMSLFIPAPGNTELKIDGQNFCSKQELIKEGETNKNNIEQKSFVSPLKPLIEETKLIEYYTNRGNSILKKALNQLEYLLLDEFFFSINKFIITYYDNGRLSDQKNTELLEREDVQKNRTIIFKVMPERTTWRIDDKRESSRILRNCKYLPKTYLNIESFRSEIENYSENKIWFSKSRGSAGGRGVSVFKTKELEHALIGNNNIIQEGVQNIVLYNNKKFVLRTYILLHNKKSYLYKNSIAFIHKTDYHEDSTDYDAQISHVGYQLDSKTGVKLVTFSELFPDMPGMKELAFKRIFNASREVLLKFKDTRDSSSETDYVILGVDNLLIWTNDAKKIDIRIVEINRYPNLVHTPKINVEVNQKMLVATFSILLNIENLYSQDYVPLTL